MIQQKVAEFRKIANYTNISNGFKSDYLLSTFPDLSSYQRDILIGISIITMLGILFTNVTVIICLFKTHQTNNPAFHTILLLSFSDFLFALLGIPTFIFGTIIKTNSRVLEIASPFLILLFSHVSMYVVGLTGVDRFVRINYYIKHREILTLFRVFMVQILIWGLALLNTKSFLLDLLYRTGIFHLFIASCDGSLIILVVVLQIKTMSSTKTLALTESSLN